MLFNSYSFIFLFLPVVMLGFFQLARLHHAYAAAWLAIASLFFYGFWMPEFTLLLVGSIACNFAVGLRLVRQLREGQTNPNKIRERLDRIETMIRDRSSGWRMFRTAVASSRTSSGATRMALEIRECASLPWAQSW